MALPFEAFSGGMVGLACLANPADVVTPVPSGADPRVAEARGCQAKKKMPIWSLR